MERQTDDEINTIVTFIWKRKLREILLLRKFEMYTGVKEKDFEDYKKALLKIWSDEWQYYHEEAVIKFIQNQGICNSAVPQVMQRTTLPGPQHIIGYHLKINPQFLERTNPLEFRDKPILTNHKILNYRELKIDKDRNYLYYKTAKINISANTQRNKLLVLFLENCKTKITYTMIANRLGLPFSSSAYDYSLARTIQSIKRDMLNTLKEKGLPDSAFRKYILPIPKTGYRLQ